MNLKSRPSSEYSSHFKDIEVTNVQSSLSLSITIGEREIIQEVYQPLEGKVIIKGLRNILTSAFEFLDITTELTSVTPFLNFTFKIQDTIAPNIWTEKIYYSRIKSHDYPFKNRWMTSLRHRSFFSNRIDFLYCNLDNAAIIQRATYIDDAGAFKMLEKSTVNNFITISTAILASFPGKHNFVKLEFEIIKDNRVLDAVIFDIRKETLFCQTIIYRNCFGIPEAFHFEGGEKMHTEKNINEVKLLTAQKNLESQSWSINELYTALLNLEQFLTVKTMFDSPQLYLVNNYTLIPILITDVNDESSEPSNSGYTASISYKYSLDEDAITLPKIKSNTQIFSSVFSKHFK